MEFLDHQRAKLGTMRRQAEVSGNNLVELADPLAVRALLMDPDKQWKVGRSAAELTYSWWDGIPSKVAATLATDASLRGAICDRIVFEKTTMPGAGGSTRTDLVAYATVASEQIVIAVEGKAGESFDKRCADWLLAGDSPGSKANREARLRALATLLGCSFDEVGALRYQLFVRFTAALIEAKAAGSTRALMLVHSFDEAARGTGDFFAFAKAIGFGVTECNRLSNALVFEGVAVQLGWVRDAAR